jgi:uncharacterized protein YndB with AHSA1/START domain
MPNIHQEVIIGVSAEEVFHALTSEEGLSAWWTPQTTALNEVGTVSRFGFGPNYFKEMRITELEPFKYLEWSCLAGAHEWIGTTLKFTLSSGSKKTLAQSYPEAGDQLQQQRSNQCTLLQLQHNDWTRYSLMFAECSYTWAQFLRSIKLFCETGNGTPWPNQHRSI